MAQPGENKSAWWIKDSYSEEEIGDLVKWGLEHFWMQNHQMADLVAPDGYNIMTRGEGNYVYDIQGRRYIDGMAGLFLKNIGHRWPEIANAVSEQMTTLAYANSGAYSSVPGILLAKKISDLAPGDLTRTFFCGDGEFAKRFTEIIRDKGLAIRVGDNITLSPPLTVTKEIIDDIVDILDQSLTEIEREFPLE